MNKKFTYHSILMLALIFCSKYSYCQSLFKDLNTGVNVSSNPDQFLNVNGIMYFTTKVSPGSVHQLWKSDGTPANTILVKDSIINTNVGNVVYFRGSMNGYLYYSVNNLGITAGNLTLLWKTNGSTPIFVDSLLHSGGGYPTSFTVVGSKLFFSMNYQLWVTDGTKAGTMQLGNASNKPMIAFNGKVYYQNGTLYSSDGTVTGTTLASNAVIEPENFIVYKGELYFGEKSGNELWKTDGTTTVKIANTNFSKAIIFKNELFYGSSNKLSKSDGTTLGTVVLKDTAGSITGANNDYIFTMYLKSLTVPPYYDLVYSRSDGTTPGTVLVSKKLGASASFQVLNNKMYNTVADSGLYTSALYGTDGTESGTTKHDSGYIAAPYVFNSKVFYSKQQTLIGYELWSLSQLTSNKEITTTSKELLVYPNPSTGIFKIDWNGNKNATIQVINILGKEILNQVITNEIDLSYNLRGIYFIKITDENTILSKKIIYQ